MDNHATSHSRSNIGTVSLQSQLSTSPWLSQSECDFILQGCCSHCRTDGRTPTELRHYTVVAGASAVKNPSSSSIFLSALRSSYGSSRLYDTATNGAVLDLICSVRAELVQTSSNDDDDGALEIKLCSIPAEGVSSEASSTLRTYEMALQKYYVPCLLHAIRQLGRREESAAVDSTGNSILCVIPGTAVWKLYVDVLLLSSSRSPGSSVYYLDAVTHGINAALFETVLPSLTVLQDHDDNTLTILNNMVLDADRTQPLLHRTAPWLPVVISVHAIPCRTKAAVTWIMDATAEEASVASFVVHAVVVPSDEGAYPIGGVWTSSSAGLSLPLSQFPESWQLAQAAAPSVYEHFAQHR